MLQGGNAKAGSFVALERRRLDGAGDDSPDAEDERTRSGVSPCRPLWRLFKARKAGGYR